jgi:hypothetical protein
MSHAVMDERSARSGEGRKMGKNLGSGKKKKKGGGGKVLLFLLYTLACGVGGAWVDRTYSTRALMWVGDQVQTLSGYGNEQAIRGVLQDSALTRAEQQQAMQDVSRVYEARRQGRLGENDVRELSQAEVIFEQAARTGVPPEEGELRDALEVFHDLAR